MSGFKKEVAGKVDAFLAEKGLENTTLTCSGTGVNGGIQYVVLDALGPERLNKLATVNLVSGSVYSYLCYLAWQENEMQFDLFDMKGWDKANRQWHDSSFFSGVLKGYRAFRSKRPMFENALLSRILSNTVTNKFALRKVGSLPRNCKIWTYNKTSKQFVAITHDSAFRECSLSEVVRFASSVPVLYGSYEYLGEKYVDPVYSGQYSSLLKQFKKEAKSHLVANLFDEKRKGDTLFIRPHTFKNPKMMISEDFVRMLLNIPNPRINVAHKLAFSRK